uniref:Sepiapterin reductase n=1 Tax=Chlorobium chlorochromatii (strain CaD3) TaxID=340177 RepID=Q3ASR1_CHLCH
MQHIILITGAGKGIGRAIALDFAKATSPTFQPVLVLVSRTLSELESLAAECHALGAETHLCAADISNLQQIDAMVNDVVARYGTIHCLINNAGVGRFKPFAELTPDDYEFVMDTNLKGTFFLTQKVFPFMEKQQLGHIFFITSVAAETAFSTSALYCMSKFGQKGFVEVMRLYARKCNVRITNVLPGAVLTPMWGEVPDAMQRVMMQPEDISQPIVQAYLLPQRTSIEELVIRPVAGDINE